MNLLTWEEWSQIFLWVFEKQWERGRVSEKMRAPSSSVSSLCPPLSVSPSFSVLPSLSLSLSVYTHARVHVDTEALKVNEVHDLAPDITPSQHLSPSFLKWRDMLQDPTSPSFTFPSSSSASPPTGLRKEESTCRSGYASVLTCGQSKHPHWKFAAR